MKSLYVTGTDTGVGKTLISAGLARLFADEGQVVRVMKPFASGSWEDSKLLKSAARVQTPLKAITPFYFRYALAPLASLALEKRSIQPQQLRQHVAKLTRGCQRLIVEGIGGAAVPITARFDASDVPRLFKWPVIVVARAALGTLNHTYLTVQHLRQKKLQVKGIILNSVPKKRRGLAERTNPRTLEQMTGVPVLGTFPAMEMKGVQSLSKVAQLLRKHIELDTLL